MKLTTNVRPIFILLAILVAGICAFFWWHQKTPMRDAIPAKTAMVFEISYPKTADQTFRALPEPWRSLLTESQFFATFKRDLSAFEHILMEENGGVGAEIFQNRIMAMAPSENQDSTLVAYILELSDDADLAASFLDKPNIIRFFPYKFKDFPLWHVNSVKYGNYSLAQCGKMLLFSRQSYLIENSLLALHDKNQRSDLARITAEGAADFSLDVDWSAFLEKLQPDLKKEYAALVPELKSAFTSLHFEGIKGAISGQINSRFSRWPKQKATNWKNMSLVAPADLACFMGVNFPYNSGVEQFLKAEKSAEMRDFILPWTNGEMGFALPVPGLNGLFDEKCLIFGIRDLKAMETALLAYSQRYGALKAYDYQTFKIRQFLSNSILKCGLWEEGFAPNPTCVQLDRYLVFGPSTTAVERWVDQYIVNQTLAGNAPFLLATNPLKESAPAFFQVNLSELPHIFENILQPDRMRWYESDIALLAKGGMAAAVLSPAKDGQYALTLGQSGSAEMASKTGILWRSSLDAPAETPVLFPKNSDHRFIYIQDIRHQLYCFDKRGKLQWKRTLNGPILSEIYPLTRGKETVPVLLLNTASAVYLLRPDGKDEIGFPLVMQAKAVNGLETVRFDPGSDFSFFLCSENGNMYGFDAYGRPIPGWNPQAGVGIVAAKPLHFQSEGKDYLSIINTEGKTIVFGRNGDLRFPPIKGTESNGQSLQFDPAVKSGRIVGVNGPGKLFVANEQGANFGLLSVVPKSNFSFIYKDFEGDSRKDYLILNGTKLSLYSYTGDKFSKKWEKEWPSAPDALTDCTSHPSIKYLSILDKKRKKIWLLNGKGQTVQGFPLEGDMPFVFANESNGETIYVSINNQLVAYGIDSGRILK